METSWLEMRWTRSFYLVFVLFLTLVLLQAIKLFLRRQHLQRVLRAFPGPSPHWLTGNQKLFQDGDFELFDEFVKKYPCAFPAWIGPFEVFFQIYDPDYAKTFMNRSDPKSQYFYKYLTLTIGEGLVSLNGNRWYQHRRLITPVFNFNTLKSHSCIMAQSINTLLDKWEKICGTQEAVLEVFNDISLMSLDTLMKCTFSRDTNCQINSALDDYTKWMCEGSEIIYKRAFSFSYHHDIIFKFSPKKHRLQKITNNLYQYTGMTVCLNIWGLHHNPAIWENPKVFDPLRFSPDNLEKRHTYSFLPFSAGPRNCIGQHFAMTELKMAIAMILLRFEMTLDPTRPFTLVPKVILKPKNGFYLSLKKIS